jgi:hypothetical protein
MLPLPTIAGQSAQSAPAASAPTPAANPAILAPGSVSPTLATGSSQSASGPHALIGGTHVDFAAQLGAPNDHSDSTTSRYGRCPGSSVDQFAVGYFGDHAVLIQRQECGQTAPSMTVRLGEAVQFLPTDTVTGPSFVSQNGANGVQGTSASLAARLPSDAFRDCTGKAVPPGTFSVIVTSTGWSIAAGTCP